MRTSPLNLIVVSVSAFLLAQEAPAAGIRTDAGFYSNTLPANDDGSTGFINFGFANSLNFFGVNYSGGYVNNNGNLTFDAAMSTFTPFNIITTGRPMLAPFFADVDTRGAGSGLLRYGGGVTIGGRAAWGASWQNTTGEGVGYYAGHVDKLNNFQLVIIDRSDIGIGDFDFEFNYGQIEWETGDASGGSGGLGGSPARAGWSNGTTHSYELPGAGISGAYLDGGPNSLSALGTVLFQVRNGQVLPPPTVPEGGATILLLGLGLIGNCLLRARCRRA